MRDDDGGPAFPTDQSDSTDYTNVRGGMSLRDYFAAKALQGLLMHGESDGLLPLGYASLSYVYADAMLQAREAKP